MEINPPPTDSLLHRHSFYASMTGHIQRNIKDANGIGKKLTDFEAKFESVRDEVRSAGTRNKTIITAAIVAWSLIGGGVGVYITRGLSSFDNMLLRVDNIERKMLMLEASNEQKKDLVEKVDLLKRSVAEVQRIQSERSTDK